MSPLVNISFAAASQSAIAPPLAIVFLKCRQNKIHRRRRRGRYIIPSLERLNPPGCFPQTSFLSAAAITTSGYKSAALFLPPPSLCTLSFTVTSPSLFSVLLQSAFVTMQRNVGRRRASRTRTSSSPSTSRHTDVMRVRGRGSSQSQQPIRGRRWPLKSKRRSRRFPSSSKVWERLRGWTETPPRFCNI